MVRSQAGISETTLRASAQQPRQMFLSRAFISASSALIESTYFPLSTFEAGAVRDAGFAARGAGFAAADEAAGDVVLS